MLLHSVTFFVFQLKKEGGNIKAPLKYCNLEFVALGIIFQEGKMIITKFQIVQILWRVVA